MTRHIKAHGAPDYGDDTDRFCRWFIMCDNLATTTHPHATLGDVPVCQRCKDKLVRLGAKVPGRSVDTA